MVPTMNGWIWQMYVYVPAAVNLTFVSRGRGAFGFCQTAFVAKNPFVCDEAPV
jgi:hypothetical protein